MSTADVALNRMASALTTKPTAEDLAIQRSISSTMRGVIAEQIDDKRGRIKNPTAQRIPEHQLRQMVAPGPLPHLGKLLIVPPKSPDQAKKELGSAVSPRALGPKSSAAVSVVESGGGEVSPVEPPPPSLDQSRPPGTS
jgi:hypothetical protein